MVGPVWFEVGRASSNYQITHHVQHLSAMVHFESESTNKYFCTANSNCHEYVPSSPENLHLHIAMPNKTSRNVRLGYNIKMGYFLGYIRLRFKATPRQVRLRLKASGFASNCAVTGRRDRSGQFMRVFLTTP
jgi:hypothetical protein